MIEKPIRQRARLAMGDSPMGYRAGGTIGTGVDVAKPVAVSVKPGSGLPTSALETARRNNGVKGMKKGGKC